MGEALIIAAAACVLGSAMGLQGAWAGRRMNSLIIGLELKPYFPVLGIGFGWAMVITVTVLAAIPAGYLVMRASPRELLSSR